MLQDLSVCRYALSPWSLALQTTLQGEQHAPERRYAEEASFQDVVMSQKWRSAEIDVTLGLVLRVSQRKECPMTTYIAVRCPHCQKDPVAKRGTTARGTQRYLCQNTICAKNSFLLAYHNRGCLPE